MKPIKLVMFTLVAAPVAGSIASAQGAMRQAFFRDAGAQYGDIVFWSKPSDWMNQTTTPNASARYVYFNFNTKDGPVVLEIPAALGAGLFGTLLDAWQVPLADVGPEGDDQGKGGTYLLLPPGFKGNLPGGYIPVRAQTYNGYALLRAVPKTSSDEDVTKALALVKQLRLYPLSKAANPAEQRYMDMTGKLFDGIVRFDGSFYASLAQMINEEPVLAQDLAMMGILLPLGIEKGKEFRPDAATRAALSSAIREAHAWLMNALLTYTTPFWTDSRWAVPAAPVASETAFSFERANYLDVDASRNRLLQLLRAAQEARGGDFLSGHVHRCEGRFSSRRGKLQVARSAQRAGTAILGVDALRPGNLLFHSRDPARGFGFLRPENAEER